MGGGTGGVPEEHVGTRGLRAGRCQGILGHGIALGIAFCGMMKPPEASLVLGGAEDISHGMPDCS